MSNEKREATMNMLLDAIQRSAKSSEGGAMAAQFAQAYANLESCGRPPFGAFTALDSGIALNKETP